MIDQDLVRRRRQWAEFNEWERSVLPPQRTPAACVADVGALREWFSSETNAVDPDPEKLGIQRMRAVLARLLVPR